MRLAAFKPRAQLCIFPALLLATFLHAATGDPVVDTATNPTAVPIRPSKHSKIDKGELLGHLQYLASAELRGREAGTPDQIAAAKYVAAEFERYGLQPFGDEKDGNRTFFQEFALKSSKGPSSDS